LGPSLPQMEVASSPTTELTDQVIQRGIRTRSKSIGITKVTRKSASKPLQQIHRSTAGSTQAPRPAERPEPSELSPSDPSEPTGLSELREFSPPHSPPPLPRQRKSARTFFRLGTWNCARGLSDDDKGSCYLKKQLLRSYHCLGIGVTEPQKPFRLKGYDCRHALPHLVVQDKVNASICVMEACPSTLRKQEVNYVSVVCSSQPFQRPTLLACLYLNPSAGLASLNDATLRTAADDIGNWLSTAGTEERHYVLMGDFNTTHQELLGRDRTLRRLLADCHRSRNAATAKSRQGQRLLREIDLLYSSWPCEDFDLELDLEGDEGAKISDHQPVLVVLHGRKSTERQIVPSRPFARDLTRHILSSPAQLTLSAAQESLKSRHMRHKAIAARAPWEQHPDLVTLCKAATR
jgi:hypothetical protein